jgi:hypothetical protein
MQVLVQAKQTDNLVVLTSMRSAESKACGP